MPIEITPPPAGVYDWRVPYTLDNVDGAMRWRYSPSRDAWYLSFYSGTGELLVGPVAASAGVNLFEQWQALDIPPGSLAVEFDGATPGRQDFGDRARLVYTSVNES